MVAAALLVLAQTTSLKVEPNYQLDTKQSVHFEVKAQVANEQADLAATAVLKVTKTDASGAELTIDWQDIVFSSSGADSELPFSPYKISLGPDGNLVSVDGGTPASDPARTVMITFFPKPPVALTLNAPLDFSLPAQKSIPAMKVTETFQGDEPVGTVQAHKVFFQGDEPVGTVQAHKVLVIVQETGPQSQDFRLNSTFWIDTQGNVLKEDGKFSNLPVAGAGTGADGTITAKPLS